MDVSAPTTIQVRDATVDDIPTIAAFNTAIASETENHELDQDLIHAGVTTLLADGSKGRYWLAEIGGQIAGQIMVTYEFSDWRNGTMWWIQSVYVHAEHRRKGVFSALYRHVESLARGDGQAAGIRLYVDESNRRAQNTYRSLGMRMRDYRIMEVDFRKDRNSD